MTAATTDRNPVWKKLKDGDEWTPGRIRALREMSGMGRDEFAKAIGSTERTIYRWENGVVRTKIVKTGGRALARFAFDVLTPIQLQQLTEVDA